MFAAVAGVCAVYVRFFYVAAVAIKVVIARQTISCKRSRHFRTFEWTSRETECYPPCVSHVSEVCCNCHGYGMVTPRGRPAQVLVCFAVREEARGFPPPQAPATEILFTGIGPANAARKVRDWLSRYPPRLLLTCGYAGGLNPQHRIGRILFDAAPGSAVHQRLLETEAVPARFIHSDRVVIKAGEKSALFKSTGGDAVEMESSAIRSVCRELGVPLAIVRVISDTADEDLPMDFNRFARKNGNVSIPHLLWGIVQRPSVVPDLVRFQKRLKLASHSLGKALQSLLAAPNLV